MACWFNTRPLVIGGATAPFSLMFSPVSDTRGELSLIDRHYGGLQRVLRRMRVLDVSMVLKPSDVANLDIGRPIRLHRVTVGDLVLSDHYFYLNKISSYNPDTPCRVTLVAF